MSAIAIITARGGSKRIPHKNIKEFCGKPIIAYSIEAAIDSNLFDEVMVSTDDTTIAEIAKQYNASVPFLRSADNSNDFATTAEVIDEVLSNYEKEGKQFDCFCCIYPTAPFVTSQKLIDGYHKMIDENGDYALSVVKFSFPPQRGFIIKDGQLKYQYPEYAKARSQDLESLYHDAGQFYFCKTDAFKKSHSLVGENAIPIIFNEEEVQDIDNESDWIIAEMKYKLMKKGE